jgi:hypothetical protein
MKKLIIFLIIFVIITALEDPDVQTHRHDPIENIKGLEYYDDYTDESDTFWISDKFKQLSEKLGFTKKQQLNRTDIKNFLYNLAGYEGDESKIPQGIKDIYDDYLKDLGENFNATELKDKLNITKLFNSVKDYYTKTNQPTYLEKIQGMFDNTWHSVSHMFRNLFGQEEKKKDTFMDQFNQILENMGLKEQEKFNKNDISKILHKWLIRDKDTKTTYPESVKEIFNRLMNKLPDEVSLENMKEYLNYDMFMDAVKNITTTHYGEGYLDKFQDVISSSNMTEILSKLFNFTMSHEEL